MISTDQINNFFGDMDLFLMDAVLKGHISSGVKVLDIGFGSGRNTIHFLQNGYEVFGMESDQRKLDLFRFMVESLYKEEVKRFVLGNVQSLPYPSNAFDVIICSRILHFMKNEFEFKKAWQSMTTCLRPGGVLYVAVNSTFGLKQEGSSGLLFNEQMLKEISESKEYIHLELPRHVSFDQKNQETTLVLRKA